MFCYWIDLREAVKKHHEGGGPSNLRLKAVKPWPPLKIIYRTCTPPKTDTNSQDPTWQTPPKFFGKKDDPPLNLNFYIKFAKKFVWYNKSPIQFEKKAKYSKLFITNILPFWCYMFFILYLMSFDFISSLLLLSFCISLLCNK